MLIPSTTTGKWPRGVGRLLYSTLGLVLSDLPSKMLILLDLILVNEIEAYHYFVGLLIKLPLVSNSLHKDLDINTYSQHNLKR